MKLARLYTNKDGLFTPIAFHDGLNIIFGEIRHPDDKSRNTHNLGKSTLCQIIDFCLLKDRKKDFFLFRHQELFGDFVFYLVVEFEPNKYLTIRRAVHNHSRISLKEHDDVALDCRELGDAGWTQRNLPLDRARKLVDGYFNLTALKPWPYRKVIPYLLRSQSDFIDVFEPSPFNLGKDRNWKPFLVHIIGFNEKEFVRRYDLETEIDNLEQQERSLSVAADEETTSPGELDALISIKRQEVQRLQQVIDDYKFEPSDQLVVGELVDDLEQEIADLNDRRYELRYAINRMEASLEKEQLIFSTEEAKSLFAEAGVLFEGQLEKDFDQLIHFNREITDERRSYLKNDLKDAHEELLRINLSLKKLDEKRAQCLRQIGSRDSLEKFKRATNSIVGRRTELELLENKRSKARELLNVRKQLAQKKIEATACVNTIQDEIERVSNPDNTNTFTIIRSNFDEIILKTISKHGVLSLSVNKEGHAEPHAEIRSNDGASTNADEGNTYRKLLCIAFDMSLVSAHHKSDFPSFVFHDDAFSGLDERVRNNLLDTMRQYANRGVQQIVTVIDSDMPSSSFSADEIIVHLNDNGDAGRLFKMPEW